MKARIPSHREFIINFPDSVDQAKANEGWAKLQQIVEDYKKAHNGASVYAPTFIEDCEPAVKKLQEEYGFEYTVEALKNRSAAPASPPCFRRRRRSAPLLFESTLATLYKLPDKTETPVSLQHWSSWWARVDYASRASKKAPQGPFCRRDV